MNTIPLFMQLRLMVIEPTLAYLGLSSPSATNLLLGTAAQETGFAYLSQYPTGPARGIYQIEPATHHDVLDNFVKFRPTLSSHIDDLAFAAFDRDQQLAVNLSYATAIARIIYMRATAPLPDPDDVDGLGRYWKEHFNTASGAGSVDQFVENYRLLVSA
jgi:hypothetical protein